MWYPQGTLNDKRPYFRLKCVALKRLPNKLSQIVKRTDSLSIVPWMAATSCRLGFSVTVGIIVGEP